MLVETSISKRSELIGAKGQTMWKTVDASQQSGKDTYSPILWAHSTTRTAETQRHSIFYGSHKMQCAIECSLATAVNMVPQH